METLGHLLDLDSLMLIPALTLVGVIGAVVYVGGFLLVQVGLICGNSVAFALSKVIAATLVMSSLWLDFNLSAFLLQVSFFLIGIYGIALRLSDK